MEDKFTEVLDQLKTLIEKEQDEKVEWMCKYYLLRDEEVARLKRRVAELELLLGDK